MAAEAAGSVQGSRSRPRHTTAHLLAGLPLEEDRQRGSRMFVSDLLAPAHCANEPRPVPNLSATISGLLVEHPRGELAGLIV